MSDLDFDRIVPSIIGAGLVCLDIIQDIGSVRYLNGGSCGNVVSGLSFLGWKASVLTGHYCDSASRILDSNFRQLGVERIETGHKCVSTPRIIEHLCEGGEHKFLLSCPECGKNLPRIKPLEEKVAQSLRIVKKYDVFYTDRSSHGIKLLRNMFKTNNSWTMYEPNSCRNLEAFMNNSLESHLVKFSSEKIPYYLAERLRVDATSKGSTVLIVRTEGKSGLYFSYRKRDKNMSQWIHLDAQPVADFVDSSGAGDWCTTGLLFSLINRHRKSRTWLKQLDVIASLQYGQALAAISCAFLGAQGLIYADAVEKLSFINDKTPKPSFIKLQPASLSTVEKRYCPTCLLPS